MWKGEADSGAAGGERILKEVLSFERDLGISVKIGTENPYESLKNCSLITATYEVDGKTIGTLVLGPTRMEYSKSVSIMGFYCGID